MTKILVTRNQMEDTKTKHKDTTEEEDIREKDEDTKEEEDTNEKRKSLAARARMRTCVVLILRRLTRMTVATTRLATTLDTTVGRDIVSI